MNITSIANFTLPVKQAMLFNVASVRLGFMGCDAAQRQLSAALLATFEDRHERRHDTSSINCAQPRGRASGVRCTPMLGGVVIAYAMSHAPGYTFCHAPAHVVSMRQTMTVPMRHAMSFAMRFPMRETMPFPMIMRLHV